MGVDFVDMVVEARRMKASGVARPPTPVSKNGAHMTIQTRRFVRKPFYVDAIQVTSANIEQVAEWCGGVIKDAKPDRDLKQGRVREKYIEVNVHRPYSDRQKMAFVTDWVLFHNGGYKVYTNLAFEKSFAETPPPGETITIAEHVIQEPREQKVGRDSTSGHFVTREHVEAHPETTTTETVVHDSPRQRIETIHESGTTKRVIGNAEGS